MSGQVDITQLPQAAALTGTESVPIVQNGQTVKTTTAAIAGAGALNYPFLTVGQTAGLTESRYLSTNAGLSLTDNGAQGTLQVNLLGAAMSLNASGTGLQVKTGANTVAGRSLAVGAGLGITNGDGVAGNPTIALGTFLQQLVSQTGNGLIALQGGSPAKITLQGAANQISIANGDGAADPVISLANNPIIPSTGSVTVPIGTSGQRTGSFGAFRYNTTLQQFEGFTNTGWQQFSLTGGVTSFSAGTTGFSPSTDTTGAVTLSGTLNAASGGTGTTSYAAGDMLYASGSATLAKLTLGVSGYVLTAGASAPAYVAQSALSVGAATNATNVGITAVTTNANHYLTFVTATTGNLPQLVNSFVTVNPSTGKLTGGIAGGAF